LWLKKITLRMFVNKIKDFCGLENGAKFLICQDPAASHSSGRSPQKVKSFRIVERNLSQKKPAS